jgi:SAM-dependent methyltransferase
VEQPPIDYRFYGDLAPWWPLISPVEGYEEEAAFAVSVLADHVDPLRTVLELGSGGGHNAWHMRASFAMTLVDLSPGMLAASRAINPECEHLEGDMRDVRLGRTFDAVFVHDAIDYMTTESDLRRAMETAFAHCRPGGVALLIPDHTTETFEPSVDHDGADGADGRAVRYLEWSTDPDSSDTWVATEYAFVLRHADGSVDVAHETHRTGLFPRDTWLRLLAEVGFEASAIPEVTIEDRVPRELFVGRRPLA